MKTWAEFNHKDARIKKLAAKGLTIEQIARKLGAPDDLERVRAGLKRLKIEPVERK